MCKKIAVRQEDCSIQRYLNVLTLRACVRACLPACLPCVCVSCLTFRSGSTPVPTRSSPRIPYFPSS